MCVKCTRNITDVPEMCLVETCQANGSSPFNVPDMFLPVSRCLCPQCKLVPLVGSFAFGDSNLTLRAFAVFMSLIS